MIGAAFFRYRSSKFGFAREIFNGRRSESGIARLIAPKSRPKSRSGAGIQAEIRFVTANAIAHAAVTFDS